MGARSQHPDEPPGEELGEAFEAWLSGEPHPRLLAAEDGEILWSNAAARALESDGRPFARDPRGAGPRRLDAALQARLQDLGPSAVACLEADHDWVIWGQRLDSAGQVVFGLTMRRRRGTPQFDALATACHLTRAEARVVTLLLGGGSTTGIAAALGISLETLRTHLKHVYRKLGVSSRGELFAGALDFLPH